MLQLKSKTSQYKRINSIEIKNSDPMLSEFKYHFVLRKVYMPRTISLQQLSQHIHEGFRIGNLTPNSIYILQMVNVHDKDLVDLAVGFRRDEDAMKIAREVSYFEQHGHKAKVQLANGFKIFMEELKIEAENNQEADEFLDFEPAKEKKQIKEVIITPTQRESLQKQQAQKKPEFERERSREKPQKKKDLRDRFIQSKKIDIPAPKVVQPNKFQVSLLLVPEQASRNAIITSLEKKMKEMKDIISYDFFKAKIPSFDLVLSEEDSYEKIIREPLKIEYFHVLPLPSSENICKQILSRQLVYTCIQNSSSKSLASLLRELKHKKNEIICIIARPLGNSDTFNPITISNVNMASVDISGSSNKEYIVTFFKKIEQIQDYLLDGWKVQKNNQIETFLEKPSVKWDWYRLMHQLDH